MKGSVQRVRMQITETERRRIAEKLQAQLNELAVLCSEVLGKAHRAYGDHSEEVAAAQRAQVALGDLSRLMRRPHTFREPWETGGKNDDL